MNGVHKGYPSERMREREREKANKQTFKRFIHEYWWRYLFDNISAPPFLCRANHSFRDLCILWVFSYYFHKQKRFFLAKCLHDTSKCPALLGWGDFEAFHCIEVLLIVKSRLWLTLIWAVILTIFYEQNGKIFEDDDYLCWRNQSVFCCIHMSNGIETIKCGKLESNA